MKQHHLTSEKTTTPADKNPNARDITAIREPAPARFADRRNSHERSQAKLP